MSGEIIADDALMQKLVAAAESPEKPTEYSSTFGGEYEQRQLTYVNYFKAFDWYVAASISYDAIAVPARRLAIRQAYIMLTILLGGILIASVLSKKIAHPLEALSQYARGLPEKNLAVGDVHPTVTFSTASSEINQLAKSFAFMEAQLREHLKELNTYRTHLEELVESRTSELTHANTQLQQEITERKRTEGMLRKSEAFLNSIIEQSPYAMWISDEKGTLIRLNQACCDLLNITKEEVIDKYNVLKDNIVEEQGLLPLVKAVFEKGKTVRFDIKYDSSRLEYLKLKRTAFVILDVTIFPIKDENGRVTNAIIQHIDITERKQAEEQIKNQNILLEQAVQEKQQEMEVLFERLLRQEKLATIGQIAGSIAHELRNPLGAVKQSAFFLERLYQRHQLDASNPKVQEHLELIKAELDISERVISALLQMTRIKPIRREQTDLRPLIEDAAKRCQLSENIQLTLDLSFEPFMIWGDPSQLRQVFINLLTNAVQAIDREGKITIRAKQLTNEASSEIAIEDNGAGIKPDVLDKVFEPLYTTKATGTGLGLSICKQIIENHNGCISLRSEKGQGTTVTIVLPEQK
jgi:PAS domain S-box-containing protein